MKIRGFSILAMITALLVSVIACQPTADVATDEPAGDPTTEMAMPGEGVTIRPGTSDWIEERYQLEIVNIGLEELGYALEEIQEVTYPALHVAVASGELDYTASHGDLSHADLFENAGGDAVLERVGTLFPVSQGYMISKAVADEYNITNVEQLTDPEIAALFDSDGNGKADLIGCNPGWGCAGSIEHHMTAYELQDTVDHIQGQYTALVSDAIVRHEQGEPVLFYIFNPHWLSTVLVPDQDVSWLEVPFTSSPPDRDTLTEAETTVNGKNLGFPVEHYRVLASDQFLAENPVAQQWFEMVSIPVEDMNAESSRIYNGENTPDDIRRHAEEWVEANREQFDAWLEEARLAAN